MSKGDISNADDDDDECHSIPDEEPVLPINIEDIDLDHICRTFKADKPNASRNSNDYIADATSAPSLTDCFRIKPDRIAMCGPETAHTEQQ